MKSVLLSIRPKWVEKIMTGEKTIEVRKTAPKETPFKAYIYCTRITEKKHCSDELDMGIWKGNEHVIGEFICDKVEKFDVPYPAWDKGYLKDILKNSCLTYADLHAYIGSGNRGYGWNISDLKIYDKPKELSEFYKPCPTKEKGDCLSCDCLADDDYGGICTNNLTRPPQSWQYVEENSVE